MRSKWRWRILVGGSSSKGWSLGRVGSIQLTFAESSVSARWKVPDWVSRELPQSSGSMGQASRNVVSKMTADSSTKVNATRAKTSRTGLVLLLVLCLLTEGYAKTTLSHPIRFVFHNREEQIIDVHLELKQ